LVVEKCSPQAPYARQVRLACAWAEAAEVLMP
jgi:hypothetical protein